MGSAETWHIYLREKKPQATTISRWRLEDEDEDRKTSTSVKGGDVVLQVAPYNICTSQYIIKSVERLLDEFEVSTRSTSRPVELKIYYAEGLPPRIWKYDGDRQRTVK